MSESNTVMKAITGFKERVTEGVRVITTDHGLIHNHLGYSVYKASTAIAGSSWIAIQINTDSSTYGHLKIYEAIGSDSLFQFRLIEATTASTFVTGSSALTIHNRHRVNSSSYNSVYTCYSDPTYVSSSNNNVLESFYVGSTGTNQAKLGGSRTLDVEYVLKQNSTYILRLDNLGAATGSGSLFAFWYEEEGA